MAATASWASVAARLQPMEEAFEAHLDDSRDGLNLMIKQSLKMGHEQAKKTKSASASASASASLVEVRVQQRQEGDGEGEEEVAVAGEGSFAGSRLPVISQVRKDSVHSSPKRPSGPGFSWKEAVLCKERGRDRDASPVRRTSTSSPLRTTSPIKAASKRLACDITKTPVKSADSKAGTRHKTPARKMGKRTPVSPLKLSLSSDEEDASGANDAAEDTNEEEASEDGSGLDQGNGHGHGQGQGQGQARATRAGLALDLERVFRVSQVPAVGCWADDDSGSDFDLQSIGTDAASEVYAASDVDVRSVSSSPLPHQPVEQLTQARIAQRQKQVDLGKATDGYKTYVAMVPEGKRGDDARRFPQSPRVDENISKRHFDFKLKKWRRALHKWDPEELAARERLRLERKLKGDNSSSSSSSKDKAPGSARKGVHSKKKKLVKKKAYRGTTAATTAATAAGSNKTAAAAPVLIKTKCNGKKPARDAGGPVVVARPADVVEMDMEMDFPALEFPSLSK